MGDVQVGDDLLSRFVAPDRVSHLWKRRSRRRGPAKPRPPESADKRRAEIERRLDEAADVLAETLLDMWRKEQRSRRAAAHGGTS
jgi:hypothetical protein